MKRNILLLSVLLFILFSIFTHPVFANAISISEEELAKGALVLCATLSTFIFITLASEFFVAYLWLKKTLLKRSALFTSIVVINLVSWPITLIFFVNFLSLCGYFVQKFNLDIKEAYYFYLSLGIVEILVFVLEYFLLKWQLGSLFKRKLLTQEVSVKRLIAIDLTMNLTSAILGIGASYLLLMIIMII